MKAAAFSLVVLTLNVAGPRRPHQGWPTRRAAIVSRLKAAAADAAAFQEVWRGRDLDALAGAAGHEDRAFDEKLGLAVTSRLPIESSASADLGGGYGALRARVRDGKSEFDLYSARLEPGDGDAAARRLGQLFRLSEFVRAQSSTRPFALMGDLGAGADERDTGLFLDLLEGRDLCVAHGDEVCGRTRGDSREDYIVIPYSSRRPRENARAEFTDLLPDEDEAAADALRFGLRARLDGSFLRLKPAVSPSGREEALSAIGDALSAAAESEIRRAAAAGWIPFYGAFQLAQAQDEAARLTAVEEEASSARLRGAARELPATPE
ncbi:MAG TPA: endonuclease/exonuclease/phosphatase family protein [Elusimicrobiota bacterium]|nr:endonuclease/exonuclease/phosphatase family protein [Elusimicrobiota bacterium]